MTFDRINSLKRMATSPTSYLLIELSQHTDKKSLLADKNNRAFKTALSATFIFCCRLHLICMHEKPNITV